MKKNLSQSRKDRRVKINQSFCKNFVYEHFCLLLLTRKRSVSAIRNILIIPPFCKGGGVNP